MALGYMKMKDNVDANYTFPLNSFCQQHITDDYKGSC